MKVTSLINFSAKKRPKHSRTDAERLHFLIRFKERVGYRLDDKGYNELLELVKARGKFLFRRDSERGAIYGITFRNIRMKVVYDALTQTLITVLPFSDR